MTADADIPPWHHSQIRKKRILLLSGDPRLREVLTRGLGRHDFEVVPEDGPRGQVDALLLEVAQGASQQGLSLLRDLRGSGLFAPAIVLATPSDSGTFAQQSGALSAAAVLIKPIDMQELASELKAAIARAKRP